MPNYKQKRDPLNYDNYRRMKKMDYEQKFQKKYLLVILSKSIGNIKTMKLKHFSVEPIIILISYLRFTGEKACHSDLSQLFQLCLHYTAPKK